MANKLTKEQSEEKKPQVVAAYESGGDWRSTAERLGVSKTTAYRWVSTGEVFPDRRGGVRSKKILQEHLDFFCIEIEKNPRICLHELRDLLDIKFGISVTNECVRGHLDGLLYTLKDVRIEPENGNSPVNKEKRYNYVCTLLEYQSKNLFIMYMDETNINLHISRREGRSLKGTRARMVAAGSRGANIHIIGCISVSGLMHLTVRRGSFKEEDAKAWVKECLVKGMRHFGSNVVLVVDNAPCHSNVEEVLQDPDLQGNIILRLGPYSPMLNPIESIWSVFKSRVKREMAIRMKDILEGVDQGTLTKTEYRLRALETVIGISLEEITPSLCNAEIAGIQKLIPSVLNKEDMEY